MSCNRCYNIHEAQKAGLTQRECLCSCHSNYNTWTGTGDLTSPNNPFIYNQDTSGNTLTANFSMATTDNNIPEPSCYAKQPKDDPDKDCYCPNIENHECICGGIIHGQRMHSQECCDNYQKDGKCC